jgi:hypothetical protein
MTAQLNRGELKTESNTAANIGLAIWRHHCFNEIFELILAFGILKGFCAKNPPHRQAEYRWQPFSPGLISKYFLHVARARKGIKLFADWNSIVLSLIGEIV